MLTKKNDQDLLRNWSTATIVFNHQSKAVGRLINFYHNDTEILYQISAALTTSAIILNSGTELIRKVRGFVTRGMAEMGQSSLMEFHIVKKKISPAVFSVTVRPRAQMTPFGYVKMSLKFGRGG
jgi:hypothetical protein